MYRSLLVLLLASGLGACQTTGGEKPSAAADTAKSEKAAGDDDGVRCRRERQIGSRLMTTSCTTREQREREREEARHYMNRKADPGGANPGGN